MYLPTLYHFTKIVFVSVARVPPPNFGDHSFGLLIVGRLPTRITARRYHISKIVQYLRRRSNQIQGIYEIISQGSPIKEGIEIDLLILVF